MGEWTEVRLGDVLSEPVKNGIYKPKEFHGRGAKIVNMGELFAFPRLGPVPMRTLEVTDDELRRFRIEAGDLLFARRSLVAEGAGRCCQVVAVDGPTVFESSVIRARPDPARADSGFLYYLFQSPTGLHLLDTIRRQVAVAGITGSDLSALRISLPSIRTQKRVAGILGALDDKIELNRRAAETHEATMRALFRFWCSPSANEIRAGWTEATLGDLLNEVVDRCSANAETAGRPYVPIDSLRSRSLTIASPRAGVEAQTSLLRFDAGDILFGAMRPYFHKVSWAPYVGTTRTTVFVLRPRRQADLAYALMLLDSDETVEFATRHATGSTIPYARWQGSLADMPVLLPPPATRDRLGDVLNPMLMRLQVLHSHSNTLEQIRDTLLPRLMSGELEVAA